MGYCTDMQGRLCCDNCGNSGGCRRNRCPFGYCQADILCPACRKNPEVKAKVNRAAHVERGCKDSHERFIFDRWMERVLLDAGEAISAAALNAELARPAGPVGMVQVIFKAAFGKTIARYLPAAIYDTFALGTVRTLTDFIQANGGLDFEPAPIDFYASN